MTHTMLGRTGERGRLVGAALLGLLLMTGCDRSYATKEDCRAIFDRIVELELQEMGYADPELLRRRQEELKARHQGELDSCVGKIIGKHTLSCVTQARSTEELSHECMK